MNSPADNLIPVGLRKTEDRCLVIEWQDGVEHRIRYRDLRDQCHCAHCLEKKREAESQDAEGKAKLSHALPVLTAAEAQPIELLTMQPAGNYAYRIGFSDGHQTGIYSFELLRQIGDQFSRPNSLGQAPPPDTA